MKTEPDYAARCQFSRCRHEVSVIFAGIGLCEGHWKKVADGDNSIYSNLKHHLPARVRKYLESNLKDDATEAVFQVLPITGSTKKEIAVQDTEVIFIDLRQKPKRLTSMFGL